MSTATQCIALIKTKDQDITKHFFSGDDYKGSFEGMSFPDILDNYEENYVVAASYLDSEEDFSQEYIGLCKKIINSKEVEKIILCELMSDYGVYISQFIKSKKESMWYIEDCDDSVTSLSPSQDSELTALFPCGAYDFGKIDYYIKALSQIKEYKPKKTMRKKQNPLFDYQKDRNSETTIARMKFTPKNAKNRDRTFEIFKQLKDTNIEENIFLEELIFDQEKLSHFKYYYDDEPDRLDRLFKNLINIISGLKFVVKEKNFIYIGFDLENLLNVYNMHHLTQLLSLIKGVSKTWVKLRHEKDSKTEVYEINPVDWNNGELIVRAPLSFETEWIEFKNGHVLPPFLYMASSDVKWASSITYYVEPDFSEANNLDSGDPDNIKWNCPFCGEIKRTIKAKQCRHCLKQWHDLNEEELEELYLNSPNTIKT